MNIAILGGGYTGLTAAYELQKKGHAVTIYEKEKVLGGLAVGFKEKDWQWPLERAYHHLFESDHEIIEFSKEIGFNKIFFTSSHTDSLYPDKNNNYRIIPVDSPLGFLRFPLLSLPDKLRAGFFIALFKYLPSLGIYERYTAEEFIRKFMGNQMWEVFMAELFRKKFGEDAEKITTSFLWARFHTRSKQLGYVSGGFQSFVEFLEALDLKNGVTIHKGTEIKNLKRKNNMFQIERSDYSNNQSIQEEYDAVISTLPTPVLVKVGESIFPKEYSDKLKKIEYLHALVLIVQTKDPILEKTYWLNINDPQLPMMFVGQHTNFIDKKYYGGKHLAYIANYLPGDDSRLKLSDKEVLEYYQPYLEKIVNRKLKVEKSWIFKAPFAQPIWSKEYVNNRPSFTTPVENFYVANLDMTYPFERGTNYAVKLGRQVSQLI